MPYEYSKPVNNTSRAAAEHTTNGLGMPAVTTLPTKETGINSLLPVQLQKLTYATGDNYKLRIHQGGKSWMALIELGEWGGAGWHLSIFPINQNTWGSNYTIQPGSYVAKYAQHWMEYNEFHITDEKGRHFFYNENCVPMPKGTQGDSAAWGNPLWATANQLVASYFSVDVKWLNEYVAGQIKGLQEQKKVQASAEEVWQAFLKAAKEDTSLAEDGGWERFQATYQQ